MSQEGAARGLILALELGKGQTLEDEKKPNLQRILCILEGKSRLGESIRHLHYEP